MLSLRKRLPLLLGSSLALYGSLFAQIDLGWQKIERNDLPPSVEIYESTRNYPSGSLVYGVYALIDLTDPNLEWDVVNLGSTQTNKSPAQFAADSEETMYVVSNGSFFNTANGASITMLMDDANVLSYGPSNYGGTYQTHAMITRDALGRLAAVWGWPGETNSNKLMGFQNINTNTAQKPFVTVDEDGNTTESYPTNGVIGTFTEAMAGKPMLVKNGVANPPANWPLEGVATTGSFAERNPRTAVGVTADNKMIIMVIDGRQAEHSVGASLSEMSDIMLGAGAVEAVNLDGGGSSSMAVFDQTVTQPSDLEGARPVPNMMVIRRKAQIHDTEFAHYSETGAWISSGNSGNYGESKTRLAATVAPTEEPTAQGIYTLGENIVPARYEISGQWAGASNRSAATPFTIRRAGFDDQRIAVSQTANTNTFNYIGTYDLAPGDQIVISTIAPSTAGRDFCSAPRCISRSDTDGAFTAVTGSAACSAAGLMETISALVASIGTAVLVFTLTDIGDLS